ncbi:hypothetical protein EL23_02820 [Paenibacillus polymyxa]|nr:hypothetical protein EL23_02820 [Paenibacillus polymyxa]
MILSAKEQIRFIFLLLILFTPFITNFINQFKTPHNESLSPVMDNSFDQIVLRIIQAKTPRAYPIIPIANSAKMSAMAFTFFLSSLMQRKVSKNGSNLTVQPLNRRN